MSDVYDLGTVFLDIIDADLPGIITAAEKSIEVHRSMLGKAVIIRIVDTKVRYPRNTDRRYCRPTNLKGLTTYNYIQAFLYS